MGFRHDCPHRLIFQAHLHDVCGHPPCLTLTTLPGDHPAVVTLRGLSGGDIARLPISIRELRVGLPPLVCIDPLGRGAPAQYVGHSRGSEVVVIVGKVEPCDRMNAYTVLRVHSSRYPRRQF